MVEILPVTLFGAPLDTGNRGVDVLGLSTIGGLAQRLNGLKVTVYDNGHGARQGKVRIGDLSVLVAFRGGRISRKVYRGDSLWSMYAASRTTPSLNANVRAIDKAAAVLDISGGDSFTDLYSKKQLDLVTLPKLIALRRRKPLLLLPQTYGPFREDANRQRAADIVSRSRQAWARDEHSFERLRELLGARFDPRRHRLGIDVGFALQPRAPSKPLGPVDEWLMDRLPAIGLNVSGMLYNHPQAAQQKFGLEANYRDAIDRLIDRLLRDNDARIVLIPHVGGGGSMASESDKLACDAIARVHTDTGRVATIPDDLAADEIKHIIGRVDWFVGARMHSTIAAMSMRRPTAAVAYSYKFLGTFEACGNGDRVLDARILDTGELVEALLEAWHQRQRDIPRLREHLVNVELRVKEQLDAISDAIRAEARSGL